MRRESANSGKSKPDGSYPAKCFWYNPETKKCMLNSTHDHDPRLLVEIRKLNGVAREDEHECPCI